MTAAAIDLTPEVLCTCSCGRIHTREKFLELKVTSSPECPNGRVRYKGDIYEFRICECESTVAAKL